jgi:hypothetical protein
VDSLLYDTSAGEATRMSAPSSSDQYDQHRLPFQHRHGDNRQTHQLHYPPGAIHPSTFNPPRYPGATFAAQPSDSSDPSRHRDRSA